MKVIIEGKEYSPNETPVLLVFDDDKEVKKHAKNLRAFQPREGRRVYAIFSEDIDPEERTTLFDLCNSIAGT